MTTKANSLKSLSIALALTFSVVTAPLALAHKEHNHSTTAVATAVKGEHRSIANKARDKYRNPIETLSFFGFDETMTVVEITPGSGWYTEILAPALKGTGKLYGAHYPDTGEDNYYSNSRKKLVKKLASDVVYSEVVLTDFTPRKVSELAP